MDERGSRKKDTRSIFLSWNIPLERWWKAKLLADESFRTLHKFHKSRYGHRMHADKRCESVWRLKLHNQEAKSKPLISNQTIADKIKLTKTTEKIERRCEHNKWRTSECSMMSEMLLAMARCGAPRSKIYIYLVTNRTITKNHLHLLSLPKVFN